MWQAELLQTTGGGAHKVLPARLLGARCPVVFAYNGGIGDRLCNLPALRALAAIFQGRLGLIGHHGDRALYYRDLELSAAWEIDLDLIATGWTFDAAALARKLRDCDLLLSVNPWHTDSVSALLAHLPSIDTVGFFPEFRHSLPCDYVGHAMNMAFAVPAALTRQVRLADFSEPPALAATARGIAHAFRQQHVRTPRLLFVHTDTKAEKSWPRERFANAVEGFLSGHPQFTAVVVDARGEGAWLTRHPDRVVALHLPLDACFAVLSEADLFLGIDSCHLHAADLFRIPSVGLFGPTTARRWGVKFPPHWHFQGNGSTDVIQAGEVCDALARLVTRGA